MSRLHQVKRRQRLLDPDRVGARLAGNASKPIALRRARIGPAHAQQHGQSVVRNRHRAHIAVDARLRKQDGTATGKRAPVSGHLVLDGEHADDEEACAAIASSPALAAGHDHHAWSLGGDRLRLQRKSHHQPLARGGLVDAMVHEHEVSRLRRNTGGIPGLRLRFHNPPNMAIARRRQRKLARKIGRGEGRNRRHDRGRDAEDHTDAGCAQSHETHFSPPTIAGDMTCSTESGWSWGMSSSSTKKRGFMRLPIAIGASR